MADEVLAGSSVYAVTERLNADGIPPRRAVKKHADGSTSSRDWDPTSVKRILRSNTVLGRVKVRGELLRNADGIPTVVWEPILTVEDVERLRALTDWTPTPGRSEATKAGQRKRASRLLSGMIACATCGAPLIAKSRNTTGRPVYSCDVRLVVLKAARREFDNPRGISQESLGEHSVTLGTASGVYLTRMEIQAVRRAVTGRRGGFVGTLRLRLPAETDTP